MIKQNQIQQISQKYRELKLCDIPVDKIKIAGELVKLCEEAQKKMNNQLLTPQQYRTNNQIRDIKNTAIQIAKDSDDVINKRKRKFDPSEDSGIMIETGKQQMQMQTKSKFVVRKIVQKQLDSRELKYSNSELEQVAARLQKNAQVMREIQQMIIEDGKNIDELQKNIDKAYDNVKQGNNQLEQAVLLKTKGRLMKIKLGMSGVIAAIGYGILGVPGMIIGGIVGLFKSIR